MSTRSLRARLDRLKHFTIHEIGKDRDRDRRRRDELFSRRFSPGLTPREEAEFAQLRASFEDERPKGVSGTDLIIKKLRGEPLTDAERAELAESATRPIDPKNPLAGATAAFRAEISRRRERGN